MYSSAAEWITFVDGQSMISNQGFHILNQTLNEFDHRKPRDPEQWFHCIPKFTSFTLKTVHSSRAMRTMRNAVGPAESCQLLIKKSFIDSHLDEVKSWFSSGERINLEKKDPFAMTAHMLKELKKYKHHVSCIDLLDKKIPHTKKDFLKDTLPLVNRCGSMYRLPYSEDFISNENMTYNVEDVMPKVEAQKKQAMKNLENLIKINLIQTQIKQKSL